jgi:hypothetical protein
LNLFLFVLSWLIVTDCTQHAEALAEWVPCADGKAISF